MRELDRLLTEAQEDPNVVGVVLGGSRGKSALVHDQSDYDVYVVVRERTTARPQVRGAQVELVETTLAEFRDMPVWNRYTFAHVEPAFDPTGEVAAAISEFTRVDPAAAGEPLDGYVNLYYRSLKSGGIAAHLDASESVPWLLEFLFAVHGRLRPYNKWLQWELEEHPLPEPWTAASLLPRLERIVAAADRDTQQALFRDVESLARERDLGDVIDGWEPDVRFLRGA